MDVIFGTGAIARMLAARLAARGSTTLVSPEPADGPFLWRRGDPASGDGVLVALRSATRVALVAEHPQDAAGLLGVLKPGMVARGAVITPLSMPAPDALTRHEHWGWLRVGTVWGPEDPWIDGWLRAAAAGRRLWYPDLGPLRPVGSDALRAAVEALWGVPGARWTLVGPDGGGTRDLVARVASAVGQPLRATAAPRWWAARMTGRPASALDRWEDADPDALCHTPGWEGPPITPAGWLWPLAPHAPAARG